LVSVHGSRPRRARRVLGMGGLGSGLCCRPASCDAALLEDLWRAANSAKCFLDCRLPVCTGAGLPGGGTDGNHAAAGVGSFLMLGSKAPLSLRGCAHFAVCDTPSPLALLGRSNLLGRKPEEMGPGDRLCHGLRLGLSSPVAIRSSCLWRLSRNAAPGFCGAGIHSGIKRRHTAALFSPLVLGTVSSCGNRISVVRTVCGTAQVQLELARTCTRSDRDISTHHSVCLVDG